MRSPAPAAQQEAGTAACLTGGGHHPWLLPQPARGERTPSQAEVGRRSRARVPNRASLADSQTGAVPTTCGWRRPTTTSTRFSTLRAPEASARTSTWPLSTVRTRTRDPQSGLRWVSPGGLPKLRAWGQQRPSPAEASSFSLLPQAAPRPRAPTSGRNSAPSPRPGASRRMQLSSCHRPVRGAADLTGRGLRSDLGRTVS